MHLLQVSKWLACLVPREVRAEAQETVEHRECKTQDN